MKKNAIWAEQLTPEQRLQFKEAFEKHSFDKIPFDEFLKKESSDLHNMIANAIDWALTEQGFDYWHAIANGNKVPETITKAIEEKPTPEKIDENFKELNMSTEQAETSMRDKLALEAMKKLIPHDIPLLPKEHLGIAEKAYQIADAMLEARKPKITVP